MILKYKPLANRINQCNNTGTGDMAELVECARLEIVYTGNCIEGSNPPISASNLPRLRGENLWRVYRVWTNHPQPSVAGFGTSAQRVRAVKGAHERK